MTINPSGKPEAKPGPADWFTGSVRLQELSPMVSSVRVVRVNFEAGARTAWHVHPHGQLLLILGGVARVQAEGGPVCEVTAGETVWFAPGERHWHGAGPSAPMVHLAIQQSDVHGVATSWQEHVSDAIYNHGLVPPAG